MEPVSLRYKWGTWYTPEPGRKGIVRSEFRSLNLCRPDLTTETLSNSKLYASRSLAIDERVYLVLDRN